MGKLILLTKYLNKYQMKGVENMAAIDNKCYSPSPPRNEGFGCRPNSSSDKVVSEYYDQLKTMTREANSLISSSRILIERSQKK